ncbi:MAG: histidinol phosphate phosphatase domain-containing protein [Chloroflexi bacterium]|nr:histidinol phosphate phosphatase domain-containing protein [Chloroflexota bacterium]
MYDFHTHTFLSDGSLSAMELIRRASVAGYGAVAITDHVGAGSLARVISEIPHDCALARAYWDIMAIPGVELTHIPPAAIHDLARRAKELGASLVIVHGETLSEPVVRGTNLAAVQCPFVDILAHPGTLSLEEASSASKNGVFIEITTRKSHRGPNAEVARAAIQSGALTLVNSDAHDPEDLLDHELIAATARAAGIAASQLSGTLEKNPALLLDRLRRSLAKK